MREFFKGWRRKAGVVTLMMACAMTALWNYTRTVRSETVFPLGSRLNVVYGFEGCVYWVGYDMPLRWGFRTGFRSRDWLEQFSVRDFDSMWAELEEKRRFQMQYWNFRPGNVVIPLTVLSACLLLWPGKRVTRQTASTHQQGTDDA